MLHYAVGPYRRKSTDLAPPNCQQRIDAVTMQVNRAFSSSVCGKGLHSGPAANCRARMLNFRKGPLQFFR